MLLRIVVGYHFYKEGTSKLKSGTFTSKYFLASAKGPLAPYFRGMLEDPDGMEQLCIKRIAEADGIASLEIDSDLTFSIWNDFVDRTFSYYGLASPELMEQITNRIDQHEVDLAEAIESGDGKAELALIGKIADAKRAVARIQEQAARAEMILEDHEEQLTDFLSINEIELISHFGAVERLEGFERDGENRSDVAVYVDSLRGQVDSIRQDRQKKLTGWTGEVTGIWDSFESQINALAVDEQAKLAKMSIHRPFDDVNAKVKWIDRIIPWFDTVVGVLLIVGLFTRFASMAAALFLVSVILTQPPWIPGTTPTYFYFIELFALLVIFAVGAGRLGGLDFFLGVWPKKKSARLRTEIEVQS